MARRGKAWHGVARQSRHGAARRGMARRGKARRGEARQSRHGEARHGKAVTESLCFVFIF